MKAKNTYLVSTHLTRPLALALEKVGEVHWAQNIERVADLESLKFEDATSAKALWLKLVEPRHEHYWYYTLLNAQAYEELKSLRATQAFRLEDLKNVEGVRASNHQRGALRYLKKYPLGGTLMVAKRSAFKSALHFWVASVDKVVRDRRDINADLHGGSYNPVSLEKLKVLVTKACAELPKVCEASFVSAIQLDNSLVNEQCFFIETHDEYYLLDVHCS